MEICCKKCHKFFERKKYYRSLFYCPVCKKENDDIDAIIEILTDLCRETLHEEFALAKNWKEESE